MKNIVINLVCAFTIFISSSTSQAQDISGSITYIGEVNEKFVDSFLVAYKKIKDPMSVKRDVIYAMENARPEDFILNFNNEESYYYNVPILEHQNDRMGSRAGTTPYYINPSKDIVIEMSAPLGNINRVPIDWEITNQTKQIGKYTCRQAKAKEKLYSRQGHFYYRDVVAWFAPDIPVSFGPKNYSGLPGLVLQIEDKEYTLTAEKINLNPKEDLKIKRVENLDNVISEEESHNRIKEMMKDYNKG